MRRLRLTISRLVPQAHSFKQRQPVQAFDAALDPRARNRRLNTSVDISDFDLAEMSGRGCQLQTFSLIMTSWWVCSCPM